MPLADLLTLAAICAVACPAIVLLGALADRPRLQAERAEAARHRARTTEGAQPGCTTPRTDHPEHDTPPRVATPVPSSPRPANVITLPRQDYW